MNIKKFQDTLCCFDVLTMAQNWNITKVLKISSYSLISELLFNLRIMQNELFFYHRLRKYRIIDI